MEKRLLLAFVLSALIFAVWSMLFPPPAPVGAPAASPPTTPEASPTPGESGGEPVDQGTVSAEAGLETSQAIGGTTEQVVTLANRVMEVELSNRGAAVTSLRLLGFTDDQGAVLDLVQSVPAPSRALPLQLVTADGPDDRLYRIEQPAAGQVELVWSDGAGSAVRKSVALGEGYGLEVEMSLAGALSGAALSAGTGLRDLGPEERDSRLAVWGDGIVLADGEIEKVKRAKIKAPVIRQPGVVAYAGLEDAYFVSLLRPRTRIEEIRIEPIEFTETSEGEEPKLSRALRVAIVPESAAFSVELLAAPKQYDLLQGLGGGVERTLDFGIFGFISVFFLRALWWIYGLVGNYGTAIILLTVGIRIVLFPLMHTSTVSMRKMAKVQPKVKEIQAKYKKKKNDPQARAKMSQETMALYKEEGVNPMAGCLPVLVQLPILWALYQLFLHAIELRHAPFVLWIDDLSAKDPYYVTPILMTATMWLQQKLAPQAGDPQQQRIMRMLPLVFGIMFLQFPSGLVLYWLTNNVISIIQQEITLVLVGERKYGRGGGRRKAS
ncbi:MAG: membrane protein insertase YidC [Thermoanaerobaculales bacterium]|jgi:YidC/Oxa1 family membrane protein insertase|nr:membrane protein insertase YidC [Thermoanaerobaculales bacterium]